MVQDAVRKFIFTRVLELDFITQRAADERSLTMSLMQNPG